MTESGKLFRVPLTTPWCHGQTNLRVCPCSAIPIQPPGATDKRRLRSLPVFTAPLSSKTRRSGGTRTIYCAGETPALQNPGGTDKRVFEFVSVKYRTYPCLPSPCKPIILWYIILPQRGVAQPGLECWFRVPEAAGSNPASPTIVSNIPHYPGGFSFQVKF